MKFEYKCVQSGQPRAYADTVVVYHVDVPKDMEFDEAKQLLIKQFKIKNEHKVNKRGAHRFPFGMDSFGDVKCLSKENGLYEVCICHPYTD